MNPSRVEHRERRQDVIGGQALGVISSIEMQTHHGLAPDRRGSPDRLAQESAGSPGCRRSDRSAGSPGVEELGGR
jgi:hypothetical protein